MNIILTVHQKLNTPIQNSSLRKFQILLFNFQYKEAHLSPSG